MKKIFFMSMSFFLFLILCSTLTFGRDYFLYDAEKNKILYMGKNDPSFSEKMDFQKNPNFIMPTSNPDKFLAIYAPEDNSQLKGKNAKESTAGQLILFNVITGRTEDLIELGFAPFHWIYTKDHRHFFITYKPTLDSKTIEMLHYDIDNQTTELLSNFATDISNLALSFDETKIFAVNNREVKVKKAKIFSEVLTLSCTPLAVENSLSLDKEIQRLYVLSEDRAVLVNLDLPHKQKSVILMNTQDNTIVEEKQLKLLYTLLNWFEDERVLIDAGYGHGRDKGEFCKVSANGLELTKPTYAWINYEYIPAKDCLYALSANHLEVIDYKNSTRHKIDTGNNIGRKYYYRLYRLPDSNWITIYSFEESQVKFFDLNENKLVKKVSCGRSGVAKFFASLFEISSKTVVTTNQDQSRFYLLNQITKDITVLDQDLNHVTYINPAEPPIDMFQAKKPTLKTLVATGKKIYSLNESSNELVPVYEFKEATKDTLFYQDENRVIVISDKELLVLNTDTLKVENNFFLFGDPNEKYTKLKTGDRRYYFIRAL